MVRLTALLLALCFSISSAFASGYASGGSPAGTVSPTELEITTDNYQLSASSPTLVYANINGLSPSVILPPLSDSLGKAFIVQFGADASGALTLKEHADDGGGNVCTTQIALAKFFVVADEREWRVVAPIQGYAATPANGPAIQVAGITSYGNFESYGSNFSVSARAYLGNGFTLQTGSNARVGKGATLSSGTVTVSNTSVTANTIVLLTRTGGTDANFGHPKVTISAGSGFDIDSTNSSDDSVYDWMLVEANP